MRATVSSAPNKEFSLKKVALLGDSIRMLGYGTVLPEVLKDEYTVWQTEENNRDCKTTQRVLIDYREQLEDADIIHWNNGLWDTYDFFGEPFTEVDIYVHNMVRIARQLKKFTDKVIFATTTPVRTEHPCEDNDTINAYNAAVVPALIAEGIVINDLNAFVSTDVYGFIGEDNIHLSEQGIRACAEKVADTIRAIDK